MKKIAATTILLLIIGNTIIMLLEKQWFNSSDLQYLQKSLFFGKSNQDVTALYPAPLLLKKMIGWMISFSVLAVVLHFLPVSRKLLIRNLLIGFYCTGCLANVLIVPHPLWFILVSQVLVIVPFLVVENLLISIHNITWKSAHQRSDAGTMEANPA